MQAKVFITGNSSGLGYSLSEAYLAEAWQVYGLSRRGCEDLGGDLHDIKCDLNNLDEIPAAMATLFAHVQELDLVYLNAGVLGELTRIIDITQKQLTQIMNVNVWSNKVIVDWLLNSNIRVKQIVAISSGAALSANKGWGCYSLSKIALNKLMELYAEEYTDTHFCSLAPGLVDTAIQDYLCDKSGVLRDEFPGVKKFREARGSAAMPSAKQVAKSVMRIAPRLMKLRSGSYADIRTM
ncbi:MAG: benzil reductase ((S)-benzoin forming) [Gammaproteobacteria bacterium]|jgi:benzil reductase ((S)-benzoin forming)